MERVAKISRRSWKFKYAWPTFWLGHDPTSSTGPGYSTYDMCDILKRYPAWYNNYCTAVLPFGYSTATQQPTLSPRTNLIPPIDFLTCSNMRVNESVITCTCTNSLQRHLQYILEFIYTLYNTFLSRSGAGIIKPFLFASCSTVNSMFLSFSRTYLACTHTHSDM